MVDLVAACVRHPRVRGRRISHLPNYTARPMPPISVSARRGAPAETDADTRVVGLFEGESTDEPDLRGLVESGEAKGALRKVAVTHENAGGSPRRVIVAGLGKRDEFDHEKARVAAAAAAARASELGAKSLSWAAPE